jgi:hypothetical protein
MTSTLVSDADSVTLPNRRQGASEVTRSRCSARPSWTPGVRQIPDWMHLDLRRGMERASAELGRGAQLATFRTSRV